LTPESKSLRVLAIEPYYGGSHQAFLDGWIRHSRHHWDIISLPAHSWKWRMRHAAIHASEQIQQRMKTGKSWDLVFCSDMLNLVELKGLHPALFATLPTVLYFHENQLTYPSQTPREWDHHFVFTNFMSAIAADHVWWNSHFNKNEFLGNVGAFLSRMPDYQPNHLVTTIYPKSEVQYPPVELTNLDRNPSSDLPLICWAARWEFDKNPQLFFDAIRILQGQGRGFRISVIGESFDHSPPVFAQARKEFTDIIHRWGFQPSRNDYWKSLSESDFFVSTAIHEFFGITAVEAIGCGCFPVLPQSLAYPEVLQLDSHPERQCHFFSSSPVELAQHLAHLLDAFETNQHWPYDPVRLRESMQQYDIGRRSGEMDRRLNSYI